MVVSFNRAERSSDLNATTEMIKYFQVQIVTVAVLIDGYYFDVLFLSGRLITECQPLQPDYRSRDVCVWKRKRGVIKSSFNCMKQSAR